MFWPVLVVALDPQPPVVVSLRWGTSEPTWGLCAAPLRFGANSRYLSFDCFGDDLTPGDSNDRRDSVLLDRTTGTVERLSISSSGQQTYYDSFAGHASADGQRAVFISLGPLHPDYWPPPSPSAILGRPTIYLRHLGTSETDLISRDAFGQALTGSMMLYGANFARNEILFSYAGDIRTGPNQSSALPTQLWVKNWVTGEVELISATPAGEPAAGSASSFSATGRHIVFIGGHNISQPARPGDGNLYLRDRVIGNVERLTWPWAGGEFQGPPLSVREPRVSADGRHVVFSTANTEIHPYAATAGGTHVYVLDHHTGHLEHVSATPGYPSFNEDARISDDGRYVAWSTRNFSGLGPPNPTTDMRAIWVLDRHTGQRANVTAPLGPLYRDNDIYLDLAPDGAAVAFTWRVADPASPVFGRNLVYVVQLRGTQPAGPPTPVPAASPWLLLLLGAGILLAALARFSRETRRPAR